MFSRKRNALVAALCALVGVGALGASAASADVQTLGLGGWQVQKTSSTTATGAAVSAPTFDASSWMPVTPDDGHAPGTEIAVLLQNGVCPNVFYSDNMAKCWLKGNKSSTPPDPSFSVPWWYRTTFTASPGGGQRASLVVNGIVGQADVWLNGTQVATQGTVQGMFTRYTFDVSNLLVDGTNSVAIKVYPNNPKKMFTSDFVDWSQVPPDNNTGIVSPIELHTSQGLRLDDTHVVERNNDDLSHTDLTVKGSVTNGSDTPVTGEVTATIDPPSGSSAAPITVQKTVTVPAGTTTPVVFDPSAYPALGVDHPQVWWPYQMGAQPLYTLRTHVAVDGTTSDTADPVTFGVRTIASYLSKPATITPYGSRWYTINGKPFVVRGGGWAPDLFWRYSSSKADREIQMIHNLGLNTVRTEGKEMPAEWYEKMDKAGILIYGGFTCCNKWEDYASSNVLSQTDRNVVYNSAYRIGQRLRNHPSVFTVSWSDNAPAVDQENLTLSAFAKADFTVPVMPSAEYKSTARLGPSGMKEGPYNWQAPNYWYDTANSPDKSDSSDETNRGGAWGFDTEASAGHTVPTLDSLNRFLSPTDLNTLWTDPAANQYHNNDETLDPDDSDTWSYSFGSMYLLDTAMKERYGNWMDLAGYIKRGQAQNYETQRSEFEAYIAHSTRRDSPSTGIVYWMLNKGWPSMLWQLYNYDYDQAGSYFGAKKANAPLHAMYTLDNHKVTVDNLTGKAQGGLSVESKVYATDGTVLDDQTASGIALPSQGVANDVIAPAIPAATTAPTPAQTYFVELTLRQDGAVVDRNVYWQSTQDDKTNWSQSNGSDFGVLSQYADLTGLNGLGTATVDAKASTASLATPDADGNDRVTTVTVTNTTSTPVVGFLLRADVRKGNADGTLLPGDNQVLPISWSDNDITLWPGESQTITGSYRASDLGGATPVVSVTGWNTAGEDVAAPIGSAPAPSTAVAATPDVPDAVGPPTSAGVVPAKTNTPVALTRAKAKVAVAHVKASLRGRKATAVVTCTGAAGTRCVGRATFTLRGKGRHGKAASVAVGRRTFSVAAGHRTRVGLTVSHRHAASVQHGRLGVALTGK